jgi:class 3 adenylate cyclase
MQVTGTEPPTLEAKRALAAIMFSDVVGYSAIMGRDEQKGLEAIARHREHLRAVLPKFHGRLIGEIGDGSLSSFQSVVEAVACARELQGELRDDPELRLRIGIHLGDVVHSGSTLLGDEVNVASRIQALAPPGGICVSASVYDEIRNKPGMRAKDLGEKKLKNVSRPIAPRRCPAGPPGGRTHRHGGSRARPRRARASVRRSFAAVDVSRDGSDVRLDPLGTALRRAGEEGRVREVSALGGSTSAHRS